MYGGSFAVGKNKDEDRAISAVCQVNELIDKSKLWAPKLARMGALRCLALSGNRKLRIYKKDARHFFHFLRIGKRWHKYLAHPPVGPRGSDLEGPRVAGTPG